MKALALLAGLALAHTAHGSILPSSSVADAFKAVPVCSGAVAADNERVARIAAPGQLTVTGVGDFQSFDLAVSPKVVDLKIKGDTLYVLLPRAIQEWSLTARSMISETATFSHGRGEGYREGAMGMEFSGDLLIIAHGRLGYSVYDTGSHEIVAERAVLQNQLPLESVLTDVTVADGRAIFVADNYSLAGPGQMPFRGFLIVDIATLVEIHRAQGIDPGAMNILLTGDTAVVGFDGPMHSFRWSEVTGRGDVRLRRTVYRYEKSGHPIGQAAVVGDQMLTCFMLDGQPGEPKKYVPMVLDLATFRL